MTDDLELKKRQINANALALEALAAFGRFRTGLDPNMPRDDRIEAIERWAEAAVLVVGEQIDELEAYPRKEEEPEYESFTENFRINFGTMALQELLSVTPPHVIAAIIREAIPTSFLRRIIREQVDGESPQTTEIEYNDGD